MISTVSEKLFTFIIFYFLPFFITIVLPGWGISALVKRIFNKKKVKLPSLFLFVLCLTLLAFLANLFWEFTLFNKVYYEWDRVFLPYTFFGHESAILDGSQNWIASGWKNWYLDAIWMAITVLIYIISAFFAYWKNRKQQYIKIYQKILLTSVISLIIITLLLPRIILKVIIYNSNYHEVDTACVQFNLSSPKILYTGNWHEWISDSNGDNLIQVFKKHLNLGDKKSLSPDSTMAANFQEQNLWIHCLNSNGVFKISLPKIDKELGFYQSKSFPSWSPNSQQIVMNNNGDLVLIDVLKKTINVLKSKVAIKDNNIDITSKNKEINISPFEVGDAYWSQNRIIYYTSFDKNTVLLHKLDLQTDSDEIIRQSDNLINISSGDPTGKWLLISESSPASKKIKKEYIYKRYILNTKTNQILEFNERDTSNVVWSTSGKFIAKSTNDWTSLPIILNLETMQSFDLTDIIKKVLTQKNIEIDDKVLVVEIKDFIDDSKILIKIILTDSNKNLPRQINGILDTNNYQLTILQDYPADRYSIENTKRIDPFQVIK